MVSAKSFVAASASLLLSASMATAALTAIPSPTSQATKDAVEMGCYASSEGMTWTYGYIYMTDGLCVQICLDKSMPVAATSATTDCYCGLTMPPLAAKQATTASCNATCGGYQKSCGGDNTTNGGVYLTVYNDFQQSVIVNLDVAVSSSAAAAASSSAAAAKSSAAKTSSAPIQLVTVGGQTVTATAGASSGNNTSSPNTAAIAAGVVVGIVVLAAIAGGGFIMLRRQKRRELEEEHKRQVAVSSFINAGKPGSTGSGSFADTRIDPVLMAQRRMSDGSIMDNQDYSRRILKVTNA